MRLSVRQFNPAANQNISKNNLWQDPVLGYFETHGKTEFLPGEQYNMTDAEKKAVLWRYRVKEILKKEYYRRQYDPHNFKYKVSYFNLKIYKDLMGLIMHSSPSLVVVGI